MTGWAIKELADNGNKLAWIVRGIITKMLDDEKVTEKTIEDLGGNVEDRQAVLCACQRAFSRYLSEESDLTRHHDGHVGFPNQSLETTAVYDVTQ